ncbi:hypothetical protein ACIRPU_21420 [Streptomyces sp. NPDC102259]|uniref:hypothetical protein n=1 Tax=Streptomyces sp. NPDC102259 TaxID=3366148 RepID=UPI00380B8B24
MLESEQAKDPEVLSRLKLDGLGALAVLDRETISVKFLEIDGFEPNLQILVDQILRDCQAVEFVANDEQRECIADDAGLDIAHQLTKERLSAVWDRSSRENHNLLEAWQFVRVLDLGALRRHVESAWQEVLTFAFGPEPALTRELRSDLGAVVQAIGQAVAISYSRAAVAPVKEAPHRNERLCCRLMALAAAKICRELAESSFPLPTPEAAGRRSFFSRFGSADWGRRSEGQDFPEESTRNAQSFESLASAFEAAYCSLAIFESRIGGFSEAWEGFVLVRRRRSRDVYNQFAPDLYEDEVGVTRVM